MIITVRNDYRIEAELTENEMSDYGITYEELDYGNIETRRVLWHILDDIRKKSGREIGFSGKLLIEVIKETSQKYRFCFTCLSHGKDTVSIKQLVKSEKPPVCMEFDDFEALLRVVGYLSCEKNGSLYEKDGKYRLITEIGFFEKAYSADVIREFGLCLSDSVLRKAECLEHWHCIISKNAIKTLSEAFSVNQQPLSYRS